jgi:hypothetical protein
VGHDARLGLGPERESSKLWKARTTTNPARIAKPVARTPNTPAARSPSAK